MRKTTEYDKINSEKYRKEIETMRKKTDLEAVKETLKLFLYMPIEETDLSPIIIQHPIFDTGYSSVDGKIVDITKPEGLQKATKKMEEKIDSTDTLIRCSYIIRISIAARLQSAAWKILDRRRKSEWRCECVSVSCGKVVSACR